MRPCAMVRTHPGYNGGAVVSTGALLMPAAGHDMGMPGPA